jgi:hypothetical protein
MEGSYLLRRLPARRIKFPQSTSLLYYSGEDNPSQSTQNIVSKINMLTDILLSAQVGSGRAYVRVVALAIWPAKGAFPT